VLKRYGFAALVALLLLGVLAFSQVTIDFWHAMSKQHGPALEALVQKFMDENPGIIVNLVYQGGYGSLSQKLIGAVAAGEPPTVAQQYENWTTQWLDALVPLEDYLSPDVLADIHPRFLEMNRFNGKLLTVPFNKSIIVLYYRPDLVPEPPTTWEEFLDLACALTVDKDGDGVIDQYGTGLRPPNPEIFLTFLAQNEGSILSDDWSKVTINDERGLETMQFMASLAKCALVQGGYLSDPFGQGLIAMFVDTSAGYPYNLAAAQQGGFEMRVAKVPCHKNCASMVQGTNLRVLGPRDRVPPRHHERVQLRGVEGLHGGQPGAGGDDRTVSGRRFRTAPPSRLLGHPQCPHHILRAGAPWRVGSQDGFG